MMNTSNLIVGAIVGYALFVIGYAVLSPHSLATKNKWSPPGVPFDRAAHVQLGY